MIATRDVRLAMAETVDKYGADYVYDDVSGACLYFRDGQPSCLIGHVIAKLTPDFKPDEGTVGMNISQFEEAGYSDRAILAMSVAQRLQDGCQTWGAALAAARAISDSATAYDDGP